MIDVNASLGNWPFGKVKHNSPAGLLKTMDKLGIRAACVAPLEGLFYKDVQAANRQMHRLVQRHRRRLLPFSVINPKFPDWQHDLDECVNELKTVGVRLLPSYHCYELTDSCCLELLGRLEAMKAPAQITAVASDPRMHHPRAVVPAADVRVLGKLIRRFAELRVCLLNVNGAVPPWRRSDTFKKADNFFIDIAFADGVGCVDEMVERYGIESVVFGTNAPLLLTLSSVYKLKESSLDKSQLHSITRHNALRWLGRKRL